MFTRTIRRTAQIAPLVVALAASSLALAGPKDHEGLRPKKHSKADRFESRLDSANGFPHAMPRLSRDAGLTATPRSIRKGQHGRLDPDTGFSPDTNQTRFTNRPGVTEQPGLIPEVVRRKVVPIPRSKFVTDEADPNQSAHTAIPRIPRGRVQFHFDPDSADPTSFTRHSAQVPLFEGANGIPRSAMVPHKLSLKLDEAQSEIASSESLRDQGTASEAASMRGLNRTHHDLSVLKDGDSGLSMTSLWTLKLR